MVSSYLSSSVRERLAAEGLGEPVAALHSNEGLDGRSGETFVVALPDRLAVLEKSFAAREPTLLHAPYGPALAVETASEKYKVFLICRVEGRAVRVSFPSYDKGRVDELAAIVAAKAAAAPLAGAAAIPLAKASGPEGGGDGGRKALFGAALMFMASADAKIRPEEEAMLRGLLAREPGLFERAAALYDALSLEEALGRASRLFDTRQKLCLLANAAELCMCDGEFKSSEMRLLKSFAAALGVPDADREAIVDVILRKNDLSVFDSSP